MTNCKTLMKHHLSIIIRPKSMDEEGYFKYWECRVGDDLNKGFAVSTSLDRTVALDKAVATWEQPKLQRSPLTEPGECTGLAK